MLITATFWPLDLRYLVAHAAELASQNGQPDGVKSGRIEVMRNIDGLPSSLQASEFPQFDELYYGGVNFWCQDATKKVGSHHIHPELSLSFKVRSCALHYRTM
jgi:hypothetical protein